MEAQDVPSGEAWRSFCSRLAELGDRLLGDDFPGSDRDRAEGYRHLANQVACWLTYGIGHTDPERPVFFRSSDPVYRWGGPNVDQVARRAMISGEGTYRVSGRMGACEEFVLQVKKGAVQTGGAEVVAEVYASQLGLGPGDGVEILLGGPPQDGPWLALDPEATFVHVRDYYFDWRPAEPATFVIERLDTQGVPPRPIGPERVAELLDGAFSQVEHSLVYFRDYQERLRARQELNRFGRPSFDARGVGEIVYSHAFVALGDGEAMVVELDPADADLWGVQLFNRAWYEPLDFVHRQTSLNHRQVAPDPDGRVRIVIAGTDPGVANWLDTEGRAEVLATIRWFRPPAEPFVGSTVVPLDGLAGALPEGTARCDGSDRRAQLAARSRHASWRFRT